MVSKEEICGMIDTLGALTIEEIYSVSTEISLLRGDVPMELSSIRDICAEAEKEHILVVVSWEEIKGVEESEISYYISGPDAFPQVPFELSETIDILEIDKREVDLSRVASRLSNNLHRRIKELGDRIDSFNIECAQEKELENLEYIYSDILNQYYDYSFWLADDSMSCLEKEIQALSSSLETISPAQGI